MIQIAGADSCVLVELHATAIEGFFNIPTNHLETAKLLANAYIKYKTKGELPCLVLLTLLLLRFIQITENNLPPIW